jgi:hypothetical protein
MKNVLLFGILLLSNKVFSQETEIRKISPFIKLETSGSFDLIIEQANEESVKIIAESVHPEKIITEVKEHTLKVYMQPGNYKNVSVKVFISYKNLEKIINSGSGNFSCLSDLSAQDFKLNESGSGNVVIHGKIKAPRIDLKISGSGNIELATLETEDLQLSLSGSGNFIISSGSAEKQSVFLAGSGSIEFFGMKSERCSISISGSGNADVNVSNIWR